MYRQFRVLDFSVAKEKFAYSLNVTVILLWSPLLERNYGHGNQVSVIKKIILTKLTFRTTSASYS